MSPTPVTTYRNPIIPGFNPDPSIVRVGSDYFLATSTFEYYPGVPIYHSLDLVNWMLIGHALTRPSQLNMRTVEPGGGVWAPTLRYHTGRFYMATTAVHHLSWADHGGHVEPRGFYVWTENIFDESSWSDPIYFDNIGFDQDLFFDDDGKVYLSTSLRTPRGERRPTKLDCIAVFGNEIDITTGRNLSRPVLLRMPSTTNVSEGSHIVKKDGLYYLFTADGGTGDLHQVWVSRSTSPMGPYEAGPDCPIVFNDQDSLVRTTGHMDIVQDESGGWWGVLLATRPQPDSKDVLLESHLGRESFLVPMVWPKGGWPVVNDRRLVSTVGSVVSGSIAKQDPVRPWRDDFDQETLSLGWYHLRTPLKQDWDLKSRRLTLYGNPYTIDQQECPAALFRKQTAFTGIWTTEIDFVPDYPGEETGTTVYWSKYAFMAAGLRKSEDGDTRYAFLRWYDPDTGEHQEERRNLDETNSNPVQFKIEARPQTYIFSCKAAAPDAPWIDLGELPTRILVDQKTRDAVFTGTHFGLYAQGHEGTSCSRPASFSFACFNPDPEEGEQNS